MTAVSHLKTRFPKETSFMPADSASPVALGDVASAYGEDEFGAFQADPQTLDLEGSALYGKAWDNSEDMLYKYDTVIEFAMK